MGVEMMCVERALLPTCAHQQKASGQECPLYTYMSLRVSRR
jgi:hypothetical protein